MVLWQFYIVLALVFVILEMLLPSMFFLNLALGALITAVIAVFAVDWITLAIVFVVLSMLSIFFLRPLLIKNRNSKEKETGIEGKYIGKEVKVTETVTKTSGSISVYDERWEARTCNDEEIPAGSMARIVRNESLIMFVEKV